MGCSSKELCFAPGRSLTVFPETIASWWSSGQGIPRSGSFHRRVRSPVGQEQSAYLVGEAHAIGECKIGVNEGVGNP